MSGTDSILSNVNEALGISEFSGTSDHPLIGNIDISGLQETALIAPDIASLSEAQTVIETGSSALSTTVSLAFDERITLPEEATGTNDLLTGLSATEVAVGDLADINALPYEVGVFTVGESGQVGIDFLFDGGKFESELAIFSLSGMNAYEAGSAEFIQEAAQRALSNSTEGYVVISDREEGARFDGVLGEHEGRDWNSGEYLGVKSFSMNPGEQFGFMLTTKGNTQKISDAPDNYIGKNQPLFSMAEANPDGEEQIADISGDQNTFGFEDLQINRKSDRDFNDIIFKLEGTNGGGAFHLEELFDESIDWRNSEVGQELIQFAVDPEDLAGNTIDQARGVQVSSFGKTYRGWVGSLDPVDYHSFSLGASNEFNLSLDGLSGNADIELLDSEGNILLSSSNPGILPETLNTTLDSGAYHFRVLPVGGISTTYSLELTVNPLIDGITTTGSDSLLYPHTAESMSVIQLDKFQTPPLLGGDPRFSGIDGSGWSAVVIDSGIKADHPFFGPDKNKDGISDRIVYQQDFANNKEGTANDLNGHGTGMASILASEDRLTPGVAYGTDIISLKVFKDKSDSKGNVVAADSFRSGYLEQALQWVIENATNFDVASINISLGSNENFNKIKSTGMSDEFQLLSDLGIITVTSSGNNFALFNSKPGVGYPAADPNVISVGATYDSDLGVDLVDLNDDGTPDQFVDFDNDGTFDQADFNGDGIFERVVSHYFDDDDDDIYEAVAYTTDVDRIAPFSQRSETLTDIFAPGSKIRKAGIDSKSNTSSGSGTSSAAPHIAGMAVLAQQLAVQELGRRLTPDEFRSLIKSTGDVIKDGDDEDDNVNNTGLEFRRANMLNLGDAIVNLNTVEVEINRVKGDFDAGDIIEDSNRGESDFYAVVAIGDAAENFDGDFGGEGPGEIRTDRINGDSDLENPGWIFRQGSQSEIVPVRIAILDHDGESKDERVDLNPNPRPRDQKGREANQKYKDLLLDVNLQSGSISDRTTGQEYGQIGQKIYLQGDGSDGSVGEVWFTIKGWSAQNTSDEKPATLAVHRVLGDFDNSPFDESDFYVTGSIGNDSFTTSPVKNKNDLRPEWHFTTETNDTTVPITLNLFDEEDDLLSGADASIDINPRVGTRSLDLIYDRGDGEIRDSLTGEVYGNRGELIKLGDPENENIAQIWFSVFGPA